jgi:hypothetical protein
MPPKKLNEKEVEQLLTQYRSERRRLLFQLENVRQAISSLKGKAAPGTPTTGEAPVKRGPGRPRKTDAEKAATKAKNKPGRRKKRVVTGGGYRLSEWDSMVLDAIKKADQLLPKEAIMAAATAWAKKNAPDMSAEDIEAKITRVLQKLSGRRGQLGTHRSGLRRGYHYGLKDWFFTSSGLLRKQHYDKLVLVAE